MMGEQTVAQGALFYSPGLTGTCRRAMRSVVCTGRTLQSW
jgi:hypothetical protein